MQARTVERTKEASLRKGALTPSALCSIFLLTLLLTGAGRGGEYVKRALNVCISSVIPGVFPMMVISSLLVSSGGGEIISRILGSSLSRIFGVSRASAPAILLGFICGFPIGARVASELCEKGLIDRRELTHLMTFVNNPSAAFVIFSVGGGMLGSAALGTMIYLSCLISAAVAGVIGRYVMGAKPSFTQYSYPNHPPLSKLFVASVSSATVGALNVCAYSAFFSAAIGIVAELITGLGAPYQLCAALFGIFELIGGVKILTESGSALFAALSTAAVCSWSGVSVLMQIISVCRTSADGDGLSFSPMILSKCLQATLSPLILLLLIRLTRFDL